MEIWKGIERRCTGISWGDHLRPRGHFAKLFCGSVILCSALGAQANVSYVNSSKALNATDSISWGDTGGDGTVVFNPGGGRTFNGLRFFVGKPIMGTMRIAGAIGTGRELSLDSINSTRVSIDFEQPVAAAGATVFVSTSAHTALTVRAYNSSGTLILQTTESHLAGADDSLHFMGASSSEENIRTLVFSTDNGAVSLGRVELRALNNAADALPSAVGAPNVASDRPPTVTDQEYTVLQSQTLRSVDGVLTGSSRAETAKLVRGPEHAQFFKLAPDGSFQYVPEAGFHGSDEFAFEGVQDEGRILSGPAVARINVLWVKARPAFQPGSDQVCQEDAGPQTVEGWASKISAGAGDEEAVQRLSWIVDNDNPDLFFVQPQLTVDGTLTYTPAFHAMGVAHLTVWLKDDGGSENGGMGTSASARFIIGIASVEHKPTLDALPAQTVVAGVRFEARAIGSSVDFGRSMTYALTGAPTGMTINSLNGTIQWMPTAEYAGKKFSVTVKAISGGDPESSDAKVLNVSVTDALAMRGAASKILIAERTTKKPQTTASEWHSMPADRKGLLAVRTVASSNGTRIATMAIRGFDAPMLRPRMTGHKRFWVE